MWYSMHLHEFSWKIIETFKDHFFLSSDVIFNALAYGTIFAPLNRWSNQLILMIGKFFRCCAEDRLDRIPRLIRLNRWLIRSNSMIDLIKFDDRRWLIRSNLVIDPTDCEDSIDWIHDQFLGIRPNTLYRLSHARSIDFKPEMNIIEYMCLVSSKWRVHS